ncbi:MULTISPECIES: Zn-ribbon domain-containing OB-fold protein [unclassified Cryobacterium]|uniref:Zn-ribbon domain-containing OB-fold protein n=1 Tax=unclassified Cryobacterium TaxID=2649013 RepID=UPI001304BD19|nr:MULTISPECIES: OB-fold domain-containing protein [unclassified Cryobacterium]
MVESLFDWADPTTAHFWEAASKEQLVIQQCGVCRQYQFYPRPFCLACDSDDIGWVAASGRGTVYSQTTVHLKAAPELGLVTPYVVAVVQLEEGPRLLTNLTGEACRIGSPVQVGWRSRQGQAPVPVFGPATP